MKSLPTTLAIALFILSPFFIHAQDARFDFVSETLEPVAAEDAAYKRQAVVDEDGYHNVSILFLDGTKRMTGRYSDESLETEDGWFEFYFYAGHKESEGRFDKGRKIGSWKRWDWTGKSLANRQYGQPASKRPKLANRPASFPGGQSGLDQYIAENLEVPTIEAGSRLRGYVEVVFTVNPNGAISNVQIHKSNDDLLSAAVIRLVEGMPAWTPALRDGGSTEALFVLPVQFARQKSMGKF